MKTNQHEITTEEPLLNKDGSLREPGYAKKLLQIYNRESVAKGALKLKEWDYYLILNQEGTKGIALTVADNGYMGLSGVSWLDYETNWEHTGSIMTFMPLGKTSLPLTSKAGSTRFSNKSCDFAFDAEPNPENKTDRHLRVRYDKFFEGKTFTCDIWLKDEPKESMVISTPYKEDKKAFYYNQKIVGMRASGWAELDGKRIEFNPEKDTAILDWGRGVWTYENTWYWGAASGYVNGHRFGWNIGYGFGDTTQASENMLFYDGKAHKLDRLRFDIPYTEAFKDNEIKVSKEEYNWIDNPKNSKVYLNQVHEFTKPWKFTSNDGRFEMDFVPVMDRNSCTDLKILLSDQHQVFGRFTGKAILDDGTEIKIKDFFGFAEKVHNKW